MIKEYEIKPVQIRIGDVMSKHVIDRDRKVIEYPKVIEEGTQFKTKHNIHYFHDGEEVEKEYHSEDGVTTEHRIKPGYTQRVSPVQKQKP